MTIGTGAQNNNISDQGNRMKIHLDNKYAADDEDIFNIDDQEVQIKNQTAAEKRKNFTSRADSNVGQLYFNGELTFQIIFTTETIYSLPLKLSQVLWANMLEANCLATLILLTLGHLT